MDSAHQAAWDGVSGDLVRAIAKGTDRALRDCRPTSRRWCRDDDVSSDRKVGDAAAWEYLYLFVSAAEFDGRAITRINAVASDGLYERRQDSGGFGPLLHDIARDGWEMVEWEYGVTAGRHGTLESFRFDAVFDRAGPGTADTSPAAGVVSESSSRLR